MLRPSRIRWTTRKRRGRETRKYKTNARADAQWMGMTTAQKWFDWQGAGDRHLRTKLSCSTRSDGGTDTHHMQEESGMRVDVGVRGDAGADVTGMSRGITKTVAKAASRLLSQPASARARP